MRPKPCPKVFLRDKAICSIFIADKNDILFDLDVHTTCTAYSCFFLVHSSSNPPYPVSLFDQTTILSLCSIVGVRPCMLSLAHRPTICYSVVVAVLLVCGSSATLCKFTSLNMATSVLYCIIPMHRI